MSGSMNEREAEIDRLQSGGNPTRRTAVTWIMAETVNAEL
jgi:hypothetical protein